MAQGVEVRIRRYQQPGLRLTKTSLTYCKPVSEPKQIVLPAGTAGRAGCILLDDTMPFAGDMFNKASWSTLIGETKSIAPLAALRLFKGFRFLLRRSDQRAQGYL